MSRPGQDGGGLKRTESYQWPSGHIGHLSDGQQNALERFKKLCQEKGYYMPADGKKAATHDEETLLRYLRARKFLPEEAFTQFKDTEDWRKENQIDTLYETIDIEEYEQTRRLYPQWTGRRDRRGIPFYVYEISHVDAKAVSAQASDKDVKNKGASITSKQPRKMLRLFALYENLCRFVLPLCSAIPNRPHGESPISQSSNVVDLSKVSITKFWSLRNHMSDASTLATAHYPETLDRIFVVGAPSFFPTVWEWAKRWFDPITVSKIFILSDKNMKETLEKFVDLENVPKKYGGKLDWSFGDKPFLEPAIANSLKWNEDIKEKGHRTLPMGPIKWSYDDKGDLMMTAIGTENGQRRNRVIAGLHPEDGIARLALSPGRQEQDRLAATSTGASQSQSQSPAAAATPAKSTPPVAAAAAPVAAAPMVASPVVASPVVASSTSETAAARSEPPPVAATPVVPTTAPDGPTAYGYIPPATTAPANATAVPPSMAAVIANMNAEADGHGAKSSPDPAVPDSSRAGTYTVPTHDDESEFGSHKTPEVRQGTSNTRYEMQQGTHAEGAVAEGTPHMKLDSGGEKQGVMDPRTVGQAPKHHPGPEDESEPAPGYLEQAKSMAGQAYEQAAALPQMAMSAVGLAEKPKEAEPKEEVKEDPRVDAMEGKNVEEFLRHQTMSKA